MNKWKRSWHMRNSRSFHTYWSVTFAQQSGIYSFCGYLTVENFQRNPDDNKTITCALRAMHKMKMIEMFLLTHGSKVTCMLVCVFPRTLKYDEYFNIRASLINISWLGWNCIKPPINCHRITAINQIITNENGKRRSQLNDLQYENILRFSALRKLNLHQSEMRKRIITHDMGPERNSIRWFFKSPIH